MGPRIARFRGLGAGLNASNDIERTNDVLVERRSCLAASRVIAEYERWSQVMLRMMGLCPSAPGSRSMRLAELGRSASASC